MRTREPIETEQACSIVFRRKKEGSLTFCVDLKKLNALIARYSYATTRMDRSPHLLASANFLYSGH